MKWILILVGLIGLILGAISYRENMHRPKQRKKAIIIVLISVIIFLVAMFLKTSN